MDNNQQKIKVLPNHIINQIAAGEVVERPASVLKEILDNSIDAGATQIKAYILEGGIKGIKVIDNGSGMSAEDAKTAFLPHSTSKLQSVEDLTNILTLGFRGEALASISSVSKVELITKTKDSISGYRISIEGGDLKEESEIGAANGTVINIREVFFNTPARRKFLKSKSTELRHIIKMFTELSLANPQIGFELHHNDKPLFALPRLTSDELQERIRNLIGDDFVNNSFPIYYDGVIKVSGFAGLPKIATSRKSTQIIIVNGRPVTNSTVFAAIKDAYHTAMPKNLQPQFVINININPQEIDINVHPRKLEVRFSNQQEIFKAVKYAVRAGLEKTLQEDTEQKLSTGKETSSENIFTSNPTLKQNNSSYKAQNVKPKPSSVQESLNFTKNLIEPNSNKPLPWENNFAKVDDTKQELSQTTTIDESLFPAYQLLNAYIVTTNGSAIQIIDQHAAAERVTYEKLMKGFDEETIQTQSLLVPFELNLNAQELLILSENSDYLKSFGIEIEEFGAKSFVVRAVPIELINSDLNLFVKELLNELVNKETSEKNKLEKLKEKILTTVACHSSIRVGDIMTQETINKLILDLKSCDLPYSCPHGRPIIYEVPVSELEKKFKRK